MRTPIARAASAATNGVGCPVLLAPSVIRTMTLASRRQVLELAEAHGERGADRGAVRQETDVDPAEHAVEKVGVGRERCLEEGAAGEDDKAQEVALAPRDEIGQDLARHHQAVPRLEVASLHAARDVERDHDVPGLAVDLADLVRHLRPRERQDQEHEAGQSECRRKPLPPSPAAHRRAGEKGHP